jgi:hypothetical protein
MAKPDQPLMDERKDFVVALTSLLYSSALIYALPMIAPLAC